MLPEHTRAEQELIDGFDDGAREDEQCPEVDYFGNEVS